MAGMMGCMDPFKKGCQRVKRVRGCCNHCYKLLRGQVSAGVCAWADHEAAGRCLVKKTKAEMSKAARLRIYGPDRREK